jgi:hypothetical protein
MRRYRKNPNVVTIGHTYWALYMTTKSRFTVAADINSPQNSDVHLKLHHAVRSAEEGYKNYENFSSTIIPNGKVVTPCSTILFP